MLPATVDPTRGNIVTSYDEGTSPEQALAAAVIMRAIEDLESTDEIVRFEAHEFFLQPKGPWAEMRQFYFSAVNLDDEWLREHLAERLDPPERPDRRWSYEDVYEILPRDRLFNCRDEARKTTLHTSQFNTRIQHLVRAGLVARIEAGVFCVAEFEPEYRAEQQRLKDEARAQREAEPPENLDDFDVPDLGGKTRNQNLVLYALLDGPMTARDIQIKTGTGSYDILRAMQLQGLIEKDGIEYRAVPQSAVAA